jgi:transcriptional regulator with XRE-family HTH domain
MRRFAGGIFSYTDGHRQIMGQQITVQRKLSEQKVADKAGLSVSYLSMLERGVRMPPLDTLETLAKALGVQPLDLLRAPKR